ncbi:hypothetical protein N431DRAFT_541720 [Stipitochalara longipes BDJ]|nr:hypothetical protein N431DRAFT_541720 [Stipitochalara longipes BDJ]
MAPSKNNNHSSSSNRNGEGVGRTASILASAYCVDNSARLQGFHYSTTGAGGANPPLAALTSANELALLSKSSNSGIKKRESDGRKKGSRGGAAYHIREECERLFCETMKAVFFGEEGKAAHNGSIVMGTDAHSPPDEIVGAYNNYFANGKVGQAMDAWLEVWDYSSGCSFRVFVGGNGENKSLFAFFGSAVVGSDLKQGLMALIELAETVFAVSQVVICLDRSVQETERKVFMKSLRWVGFELITLDLWANDIDVTSDKWLFLGMEI